MVYLTRFPPDVPLVELNGSSYMPDGTPTILFRQWWQSAMEAIERSDSGTWLPTAYNTLNIASSAVNGGRWLRHGSVVTASITIGITPTAAGLCALNFDLPVASAFTNDTQLSGSASPVTPVAGYDPGSVYSNFVNDNAEVAFYAPSATGRNWTIHFTYDVM
jgi:hypothetical protein